MRLTWVEVYHTHPGYDLEEQAEYEALRTEGTENTCQPEEVSYRTHGPHIHAGEAVAPHKREEGN